MSDRRKRGRRIQPTTEERVLRLYVELSKANREAEDRNRDWRNYDDGYKPEGRDETAHMTIAKRLKIPCAQVRQILAENKPYYRQRWNEGRRHAGLDPVEARS